jgi:hypothetical protein
MARGDADARSDVDLGLYYDPARPFAIAALREVARELDDRHGADLVTDFGGWGSWINGGGWLVIAGTRVDWLYRDLSKVGGVVGDCLDGRYASYYQPGHPHAFHTHMYMGEVHHGRTLVDRQGGFAGLQTRTVPCPPRLRETAIQRNLWEAQFALENAAKAAPRGDTFYVSGCLFRCAACVVQAVFAVNGRYFLNEKGSVAIAAGLHPSRAIRRHDHRHSGRDGPDPGRAGSGSHAHGLARPRHAHHLRPARLSHRNAAG